MAFIKRTPDVVASSGRLGSFVDGLSEKYSKESGDAAALLVKAESYAVKEEAQAALKAATDAVAGFRSSGNKAGLADAVRLNVHVLCCMGKSEEGEVLAKDEAWKFRDQGDKTSEAKMTLSLAQAHCAKGSVDSVETALQETQEALRTFRGDSNKKMIGAALLVSAAVSLEKKGDVKKKADEAKQACDEAITTFRDLGMAQGEAYALHLMACTRAISGAGEGALRAAKEAQSLYVKAEMMKQAAFELHQIAVWNLKDGDVDDAVAASLEALDIFEDDLKATDGEACVMQTLVRAYIEKKNEKDAMKLAKYELERFEDSGNTKGVAAAQEMVMLCYFSLNNLGRAMRFAQRAADTLEDMGDRKSQARVLRTTCLLYRANGEHERALRAAQEALNIFEELEDTKEQAITLQARADVYLEKKENGRALALASEARELYSDAKYVEGEVSALLQLSTAQFAEGEYKKAQSSAREAQDKSTEVQDQAGEANALRALVEVQVMEKEFDGALRVLGSLLTLVKEMGDREEEVNTMILTARALIMQSMQKEEEGKSNEKMLKATAEKSTKMAKEALGIARKLDSPQVLGTALFTVGQTQMMSSKTSEATKAAEESMKVFADSGFVQGEAAALTLLAEISLQTSSGDVSKARDLCEEAVYLFQQIGDTDGEEQAWSELDRISKVEAEFYERQQERERQQQQWQMQQWAMSQGQMPQMPDMGGGAPAEEAAPSAAAGGGGYEAKLMKLDIGSGLDPAVLKGQILEVTKGLIGYDEDIEFDNPLMESGLTSNTAVLLRDALTQQLPGVNLPVTLVFDYPSISAMSELIVENAAKAAKKAKKALKG